MYCTNCGKEIEKQSKFCPYCGHTINVIAKTKSESNNLPLILGILACIFILVPLISIPLAIASIMTEVLNKKTEKSFPIGVVLGIISIALTIGIIILIFLSFTNIVVNKEKIINNFKIEDKIDDYIDKYKDKFNDIYENDILNPEIKGYSWQADDNSIIYLNEDNTYIWYEKENDENNYYQGTFKIFNGKTAVDYIDEIIEKYHLDEKVIEEPKEKDEDSLKNYYVITLTCTKEKRDGKENNEINTSVYYYGYYDKTKEKLNFIDITTKKNINFTRKNKINNIDI